MVKGVGLVFKDESRVRMEARRPDSIVLPRGIYWGQAKEHGYTHTKEVSGDQMNVIIQNTQQEHMILMEAQSLATYDDIIMDSEYIL